jgi:hypothetical protein
MNKNISENNKNPHNPIFYRVGEKAYDKDWNELKVVVRKQWKYVVIDRVQIGVLKGVDKVGYDEPVYFGYVFKGLHEKGNNFWYDRLLKR